MLVESFLQTFCTAFDIYISTMFMKLGYLKDSNAAAHSVNANIS